jgi:hypothetical protein
MVHAGSNPAVSALIRGPVAQLGEHLFCKQEVAGSIPARSTPPWCNRQHIRFWS